MATWDDRKYALHEALKDAPVTAYVKALEVIGDMQSEIDRLGGKLMNAKDDVAIQRHMAVKESIAYAQKIRALGGDPFRDVPHDAHWEWNVQSRKGPTSDEWIERSWARITDQQAWQWFRTIAEDSPPGRHRLVCRVVSDPVVFEGGDD